LSANHQHGLRRTNEDKRHAIAVALREFSRLSDRMIADLCGVAHASVAAGRGQLVNLTSCQTPRLGRDGKIRNLPFKPGDGGEPFPLPGEEGSAHEIILEVARKFADLETTIKSALIRLPGQKPVLLGALKKAKSGLTQWARGIEAREERLMRRQLEASKLPPH
jgi:hypothetical protein